MRVILRSVVYSIAAMRTVSILILMSLVVFAIMGVQLFSGKFYSCNDKTVEWKTECVGSFVDPISGAWVSREWANAHYNFDHLGNALTALFVTLTIDGYKTIMISAMAAREKDQQPLDGANRGAGLYFMVYIVVCAFCLLNLYVGVVFFKFNQIRLS